MEKVYDRLRHKEVALTPEERVRQWFISVLAGPCRVPEHLMMSEVGMTFADKRYRADILVYGRDGKPLAVVECKRPDVEITASVAEQAMRYNMVLGVSWLFLTNGTGTFVFHLENGTFVPYSQMPDYEQMTCRQ